MPRSPLSREFRNLKTSPVVSRPRNYTKVTWLKYFYRTVSPYPKGATVALFSRSIIFFYLNDFWRMSKNWMLPPAVAQKDAIRFGSTG